MGLGELGEFVSCVSGMSNLAYEFLECKPLQVQHFPLVCDKKSKAISSCLSNCTLFSWKLPPSSEQGHVYFAAHLSHAHLKIQPSTEASPTALHPILGHPRLQHEGSHSPSQGMGLENGGVHSMLGQDPQEALGNPL